MKELFSRLGRSRGRILLSLALLLVGVLAAFLLIKSEQRNVQAELGGNGQHAVLWYKARLWILGAMCLLPWLLNVLYNRSSLLCRYIARLFIGSFSMCTGTIFLVWMLADFAENASDLRELSNPLLGMLQFYARQIPMVVNLILPYTLLLSVLWVLSKLSRGSEFVSMLQTGRSLFSLSKPLLLAGLVCAVIMAAFSYQWGPTAEHARYKILHATRDNRSVIFKNEDCSRIWRVKDVPVDLKPYSKLGDVNVEVFSAPGQLQYQLIAESAKWNQNKNHWVFENVIRRDFDGDVAPFSPKQPVLIVEGWEETPYTITAPSARSEQRGVAELQLRLASRDLGKLERKEHEASIQVRWARSASCFILVLIAIPCGLSFSRRPTAAGIGIALGLSAGMIFGFEVFPALGVGGYLPLWLGVWLTNIIFLLLGIYMFRQRLAHRSLRETLFAKKRI